MAGNNIRIGASVHDQVSGALDRMRDKFDLLGKGAASASLVGNVGAHLLAAGMNIAGQAIGKVTEFVGDSITAFREEEKSIAGLKAALQANIPAWNGNLDAIEKTIAARTKLAFSDDSQRESLKILLAVTHDSTKALDAQRVAMDLARFRGIDLASASDLIAKVMGGNVGILRRYGISLKEGATATEALTEVTRLAGGAAAAYAQTDLGKVEAANIKVEDSMERIGESLSKVGATILPMVADAFEALTREVDAGNDPVKDFIDSLHLFEPASQLVGSSMANMNKDMAAGAAAIQVMAERTSRALSYNFETGGNKAKVAINDSMDSIEDRMRDTRSTLSDLAKDIINDTFDPQIRAAELTAEKFELADLRKERSARNLTAAEKAELDLRILNSQKHIAELTAEQDAYQADAGASAKEHQAALLASQQEYQNLAESKASANQWGQKWVNTAAIGITGGIDEVYTAGNQVVQALNSFNPNGYSIGSSWTQEIASGITANDWRIDAAIRVIGSSMVGFSPPKTGPLKDIDKGGRNVAKAWLDAFAGTLAGDTGISNALSRLASVAGSAPSAAQGGLSTAMAAVGGGGQAIHVYLDGRELQSAIARQEHYRSGPLGRFPG